MNTELSRVHALIDNDGTTRLAQYSYLGLDQFVRDEYPQAGVELTYLKQGNDSNGPQGDQYNGLDYFGRVVDQRWINASTIADVERVKYGFDPNGNRLWRENTVAHAAAKKQDELYTYDGLNQLTVLKRGDLNSTHTAFDPATPTWEEDFTLDPTGNWNDYVTKINNSADLTQARTHNEANELTAIGGSPTYVAEDAAGNMTKVPKPGVWNAAYDLTYDAWNRLVKVMNGNNTVAVYAYDGLTRRTTKTIGSETRHYYYSDQWQILEEHLTIGATTTVDRQFVWGLRYMDDLVLRDRSVGGTLDERLYTLHDYFHPTAITNISGVVQERYGYDAYGTSRVMDASFNSTTSTYDWETRYGAYRWDAETGLYQVRYRYLHPGLGRWVTRDPIGERDGTNLYGFCKSDPINKQDAFGLKAEKCKEITRKDGTRFIFFNPPARDGGGWKISRLDFIPGGGSTLTLFDGFTVEWSATVEVYCCCYGVRFEARNGTRVHSKTFNGKDDWFPAYEAGAMPISIPTPTTFLKGIGEALAAVVESNLSKPISIDSSSAKDIAGKIALNRPQKPTDGKWKDKSPCEK